MKSKIKKILKNRIFLCTITALIFGTIVVSAATYFESSAVTYDNTESGLNSTNVQGAIDELYKTCSTSTTTNIPTIGSTLLNKIDIVTTGDGLYKDEYEDRYFYRGKNPNNYVTFNNEQAGWRIISIENNGTIKIVRNATVGNDLKYSNDYAVATWYASGGVRDYLIGDYYNSLTATAQNQIIVSRVSIGFSSDNDDSNTNLSTLINNENDTKWMDQIALPTVSEYIRTNSNQSLCGTINKNNANYITCINTNWMHIYDDWWTLTPRTLLYGNNYPSRNANYLTSLGKIDSRGSNNFLEGVRPATIISPNVIIVGGTGSQNDPYRLDIQ